MVAAEEYTAHPRAWPVVLTALKLELQSHRAATVKYHEILEIFFSNPS